MNPPLLLDTHALLWWMMDAPQLPVALRARIANLEEVVIISAASVWEIAIKARKGKLVGVEDYLESYPQLHRKWGFVPASLTLEDCRLAGQLKIPHGDPFDRVLIAQAERLSADFATCDVAITAHCNRVVWD